MPQKQGHQDFQITFSTRRSCNTPLKVPEIEISARSASELTLQLFLQLHPFIVDGGPFFLNFARVQAECVLALHACAVDDQLAIQPQSPQKCKNFSFVLKRTAPLGDETGRRSGSYCALKSRGNGTLHVGVKGSQGKTNGED